MSGQGPIVFERDDVRWRLIAAQDGPFEAMDREADDVDLRIAGYAPVPSIEELASTVMRAHASAIDAPKGIALTQHQVDRIARAVRRALTGGK